MLNEILAAEAAVCGKSPSELADLHQVEFCCLQGGMPHGIIQRSSDVKTKDDLVYIPIGADKRHALGDLFAFLGVNEPSSVHFYRRAKGEVSVTTVFQIEA